MENKDRDQIIRGLNQHRQELLTKRDSLFKPLQQLDEELEHISAAILSLQKCSQKPAQDLNAIEFPIGKLRGFTQVQALVAIAKHNNGVIRAQEAKRMLIRAGVMRETKNSTNVIHAVIIRSEKFERIRPGEYRLKDTVAPKTSDLENVAHAALFPSKPVQ
jgi:hypothetical protein